MIINLQLFCIETQERRFRHEAFFTHFDSTSKVSELVLNASQMRSAVSHLDFQLELCWKQTAPPAVCTRSLCWSFPPESNGLNGFLLPFPGEHLLTPLQSKCQLPPGKVSCVVTIVFIHYGLNTLWSALDRNAFVNSKKCTWKLLVKELFFISFILKLKGFI